MKVERVQTSFDLFIGQIQQGTPLKSENQIYLQEITKMLVLCRVKNLKQDKDAHHILKIFTDVVDTMTEEYSDFVYSFLEKLYT
jgi:hypothetical protein